MDDDDNTIGGTDDVHEDGSNGVEFATSTSSTRPTRRGVGGHVEHEDGVAAPAELPIREDGKGLVTQHGAFVLTPARFF